MIFKFVGFNGNEVQIHCVKGGNETAEEYAVYLNALMQDVEASITANFSGSELLDLEDDDDLLRFENVVVGLSVNKLKMGGPFYKSLMSVTPNEKNVSRFLEELNAETLKRADSLQSPTAASLTQIELQTSIEDDTLSESSDTFFLDEEIISVKAPVAADMQQTIIEEKVPVPTVPLASFAEEKRPVTAADKPPEHKSVEKNMPEATILHSTYGYKSTVPIEIVAKYVLLEGVMKSDIGMVQKAIDHFYKYNREKLQRLFYVEKMDEMMRRHLDLKYNCTDITALMHIVAAEGNVPIAKLLAQAGADVHAMSVVGPDQDYETTLFPAVYFGHSDMVTWLVSQNVNSSATIKVDRSKVTARQFAQALYAEQVKKLSQEHVVSIEEKKSVPPEAKRDVLRNNNKLTLFATEEKKSVPFEAKLGALKNYNNKLTLFATMLEVLPKPLVSSMRPVASRSQRRRW